MLKRKHIRSYHHPIILACVFAMILMFTASCFQRSYSPTRNHDFSSSYTPDRTKAMPSYVVYNINDTVSRLYFTVKSSDLLYVRSNINNDLEAHIMVEYILHPVDEPRIISDSGHVVMTDVNPGVQAKQISGSTDFDVPPGGNYFLEVLFRDINKMNVSYEILPLKHDGADAFHNFLLTASGTENPLFRNYVLKDESFSLHYYKPNASKLYCYWYRDNSNAARPPYALPVQSTQPTYDSTWTIDNFEGATITLPKEGYYRFTTIPESSEGFTLCRFPDGYPKITTPTALLEPLRYITTNQEYTTLSTARNLKASVDSFWISTGGSIDRARELISAYYGRVEIANMHFSDYREGWKTDRGMVYIIYGEPQNVYRTINSETWIYGRDNGGNMLNFVFSRNESSAVPNEYILERNQVYNVSWMTAVDFWKQGQVYRAQ